MNRPDNNNIVTMGKHAPPAVIPMNSRQTAMVVQMPSRWDRAEQHASAVITMPTRIDCAAAYGEPRRQEPARHLPSAVHLTLLALFAWLGWPPPTHGKGPGASGARPWKPAFVKLVSALHLPEPALTPRRAAVTLPMPAEHGTRHPVSATAGLRAA